MITFFWSPPDLGGGTLVGYEVSGGEGGNAGPFTKTVGPTAAWYDDIDRHCSPTVSDTVRAVTDVPGVGEVRGAPASLSRTSPYQCAPRIGVLEAAPMEANTASVTFFCNGGDG